jgi:hypothetical protein
MVLPPCKEASQRHTTDNSFNLGKAGKGRRFYEQLTTAERERRARRDQCRLGGKAGLKVGRGGQLADEKRTAGAPMLLDEHFAVMKAK